MEQTHACVLILTEANKRDKEKVMQTTQFD